MVKKVLFIAIMVIETVTTTEHAAKAYYKKRRDHGEKNNIHKLKIATHNQCLKTFLTELHNTLGLNTT